MYKRQTRWRTVSDQKNLIYFFESTLYPNVFWVDFKEVDFSEGEMCIRDRCSVERAIACHRGRSMAMERPRWQAIALSTLHLSLIHISPSEKSTSLKSTQNTLG